jgi:hypothetical protein
MRATDLQDLITEGDSIKGHGIRGFFYSSAICKRKSYTFKKLKMDDTQVP